MFHLSVKPISRAAGRSATAAAAYRSGAEIADLRTGELHNYTRKRYIEHSEILAPPGSPAWAEDRAALWNAAEASEKRKDARVARDYEVAIPKELTRGQGIELVRDFAAGLVERYGVAVDFNVHRDDLRRWDGTEKGWQGYHAHVLTSTRKLGRGGFGEKADIELSDTKRKSLGLSDGATEIERIRELWEVAANRHLEQASQAQRIDRRSLKDQGIERDPTVHLGPGVTALEREGVNSRLGDINRQVVAEEKAQRAPSQATEMVLGKALEKAAEPSAEPPRVLSRYELRVIDQFVEQAVATVYRERDQRVQRALARAQLREQRRQKASERVEKAQPAQPKGLLAGFQQKGHQQAVAAWDSARKAAARLLEQAQRLTGRLVEASGVKKLLAWSQQAVRSQQPELIARRDELARVVEQQQQRAQTELQVRAPARETGTPGHAPAHAPDMEAQRGQGRDSVPAAPPVPKDLKTQAAEGVAAFRARREKERLRTPEKSLGEQALERLKAQVEAEQQAAEERRAAEQVRSLDRGKGIGD